jgi:hypothetical protein
MLHFSCIYDLIKINVYCILEHSAARPAKNTNPEVQPSDNDNTDDEGEAWSCVFAFVFC